MVGWRDNGHETPDDKPAMGCCGRRLSAGKSLLTPTWNSPKTISSVPSYLGGVILDEEFPPGYSERLTDAVLRALGAK